MSHEIKQAPTVRYVQVNRAEGPSELCGMAGFPTIAAAQSWIDHYAYSYPGRGYDKHDIVIHTDHGIYSFRLDCMSRRNDEYSPYCNSILRAFHLAVWNTLEQEQAS